MVTKLPLQKHQIRYLYRQIQAFIHDNMKVCSFKFKYRHRMEAPFCKAFSFFIQGIFTVIQATANHRSKLKINK